MQQGGKEEVFIHNTKSRHDDSSVVDPDPVDPQLSSLLDPDPDLSCLLKVQKKVQ
jgi:hypothetical protein